MEGIVNWWIVSCLLHKKDKSFLIAQWLVMSFQPISLNQFTTFLPSLLSFFNQHNQTINERGMEWGWLAAKAITHYRVIWRVKLFNEAGRQLNQFHSISLIEKEKLICLIGWMKWNQSNIIKVRLSWWMKEKLNFNFYFSNQRNQGGWPPKLAAPSNNFSSFIKEREKWVWLANGAEQTNNSSFHQQSIHQIKKVWFVGWFVEMKLKIVVDCFRRPHCAHCFIHKSFHEFMICSFHNGSLAHRPSLKIKDF